LIGLPSAWALGTLVTADGTTIQASRTVVIRHADEIQIVTQVKYGSPTDALVWLLPIPNHNRPVDEGVRADVFPSAALDELDAASRPVLRGICDGTPTGMAQEVLLAESFGPGLDVRPPVQFYNATEVAAGELNNYIEGQGLAVDESVQAVIDAATNQNFMFVAVRINVGDLGVPRVDPIISIRYPAERGSLEELAFISLIPNLGGQPANMVVWTLDTNRHRMAFRTNPLNFDAVNFVSATETNYLTEFDTQVGVHQTQMAVLEYAGQYTAQEPTLAAEIASSGSSYLTRMRIRISPIAIQANHSFVATRTDMGGDQSREHDVQGLNCGGNEDIMPDGGSMEGPSVDGGMADAMVDDTDAATSLGREETDASSDSTGNGSGSGGGCQVDPESNFPALPFLALLLALTPLMVRRRRR